MTRREHGQVTVRQIDARVWQRALALAEGNVRRIEIIDDSTVVVHNSDRSGSAPLLPN